MGDDANRFSGDSLDGNEKKKKRACLSLLFLVEQQRATVGQTFRQSGEEEDSLLGAGR